MVNNRKEMTKSIVVLSIIALISGILLSVVSQLTALTEEEINRKIFATLNQIYNAENGWEIQEFSGESNVTGIYKAKGEEYYIVLATGRGKAGEVEMFVSFVHRQITNARPGRVPDDPGYKERIYEESFLNQFKLSIDNEMFNSEAGGTFDNAAGATLTSRGAITAVRNAVNAYKQFIGEAGSNDSEAGATITSKIAVENAVNEYKLNTYMLFIGEAEKL